MKYTIKEAIDKKVRLTDTTWQDVADVLGVTVPNLHTKRRREQFHTWEIKLLIEANIIESNEIK